MPITMYGIPNCGSIKKAKDWLQEHQIDYQFHDFRKQGLDQQKLEQWLTSTDWQTLLNKKSTTWRGLDEQTRKNIDQASAVRVMLENPSIIKRPVLESDSDLIVGFDSEQYSQIFS